MTHEKLIVEALPKRGRPKTGTPKKKLQIRIPEKMYKEISDCAQYTGREWYEMLLASWVYYKEKKTQEGRYPPDMEPERFDAEVYDGRKNVSQFVSDERKRLKNPLSDV